MSSSVSFQILLIVFQTFSARHQIYVLELASSLTTTRKERLTITVRHCLILVTAREYLALCYGLAGGLGSGAVLGAGWRVRRLESVFFVLME